MKNAQRNLQDTLLLIVYPSRLLKKLIWNGLNLVVDAELIMVRITKMLVQMSGSDKQN
jgi:hypothetical protein